MSIPNKGDIVINPHTQRPVKVGGRTWLGLVKKGIFEGRYTIPTSTKASKASKSYSFNNLTKESKESKESEFQLEQVREVVGTQSELREVRKPPQSKSIKDRVIKPRHSLSEPQQRKTKTKTKTDIDVQRAAKAASRVLNENIDTLVDSDDIEKTLEQLILDELESEGVGGDDDYEDIPPQPKLVRQNAIPDWSTQEPGDLPDDLPGGDYYDYNDYN